MTEPIGPNMVRTILGTYDPDYYYELETTDEGLCILVTNRETNETQVVPMPDTEFKTSEERTPIEPGTPIEETTCVDTGVKALRVLFWVCCAAVLCTGGILLYLKYRGLF